MAVGKYAWRILILISLLMLVWLVSFQVFLTSLSVRKSYHSDPDFNKSPSNIQLSQSVQANQSCASVPSGLQGSRNITFENKPLSIEQIEKENPLVLNGGHFEPPNCKAREKVAVLIPFRDRDEHLLYFLQYMHPVFQRQELDYRIYVINQIDGKKFNRAKLLNVGYVESLKDETFDCFVFHDVDMILENDHCMFSCPPSPLHLANAIDKFGYGLAYETYFGAVTELTKAQFEKINGFPNNFWGWGGEDDDIYNRIRTKRMKIMRYSPNICRYRMVRHDRDEGNEDNPRKDFLPKLSLLTMIVDGLKSLKYTVLHRDVHPLYTNITVSI